MAIFSHIWSFDTDYQKRGLQAEIEPILKSKMCLTEILVLIGLLSHDKLLRKGSFGNQAIFLIFCHTELDRHILVQVCLQKKLSLGVHERF